MPQHLQLDLDLLVPDAHSAADRCVENLLAALDALPGVHEVHVTGDRVCLHVEAEAGQVSLPRLEARARAVGAEVSSRYGHALWPVPGISHATRAERLGSLVRRLPGVVDAEVSIQGFARVEYDRAAVDDPGALHREVLRLAGHRESHHGHEHEHEHGHDAHAHARAHAHGAGRELAVAAVAFVAYVVARFTGWTALDVAAALATAAIVGVDVVQALRARRFDIELLMFVAAAGAAILGHWHDAALLLVLFVLGHALEGHAMARARREIEGLADLAPAVAHRDGADVPVEELAVGDVVVVRPGERIPADGAVVAGTTSVDESAVTGESMPVDKGPGDPVFAGTTNGAGAIEVTVARVAADSTLARVVRLVAEAEAQVSPSQLLTRRVVAVFVPVVLVLVAALLVVPPLLGEPFRDSALRAMAVLVASSPCALAIATPSAVLAAIARAARGGVLVKGGGPLESLGRVRVLCFDKTGTLTEGRPRLVDAVPLDGVGRDELLRAAASVEQHSDHPLARAVVDASPAAPPAAGVRAVHGKGLVSDGAWAGNAALYGGDVPPEVAAVDERLRAAGRTTILVRDGDRWLGVLGLLDEPRPAAAATVAALRDLGVEHLTVLSGDQPPVVAAVAAAVGIDDARGGLLPEDKVAAVRDLATGAAAAGRGVAMVGDGVNDAPALATATVGIAMGAAGSHTALETADIALMADRLDRLPFTVGLARRATCTIFQNLLLSLGVVAVLIPLTVAGVGIGPAVIAHEGSTVLVVANALRLLGWRERD